MKNFNEQLFLTDVASICWETVFSQTDDIEVIVYEWTNLFSFVIEKHATLRKMHISEKFCPWIKIG